MSDLLPGTKKMRSAPRTGRMLILTIEHGCSGELVEVPGCWMAPHGDPAQKGWWGAGVVTGTASFNDLPHDISPSAISPIGWRELTPYRYGAQRPKP